MNNQKHIYRPLTPQEAAKLLGMSNQETFNRKFLEKTGMRISELPQGKIPLEAFITIATHFAKNYPLAADAIGRYTDKSDDMSGRQADGSGRKSDDERTEADEIGRQADDKRTLSDANGRQADDKRMQSDANGHQSDDKRTPSDEIGRHLKTIENQQIALSSYQKRIAELEKGVSEHNKSIQGADAINGRQADEIGRLKQLLADERTEIGRLKQLVADERTAKRTELDRQAVDFESSYDKNLTVLSENVRLKVEAETRKTVTATIRKEVSQEYQGRFEKLQNEYYAAIKTLNEELQEARGVIQKLTYDVSLFNQKWEFKIKKILDAELSVINVVSNVLAFVGLTLVFGYIGALAALLMIFFFKNVMKNVKIARREEAARFGMWIAYGIEAVYGFFHYTTFFNLLKNQSDSLLIRDPEWVAMGMTVIISGLSISALIQSRKQAKDDIA